MIDSEITFLDTIDVALIAILIALAIALIKATIDFKKSQKEGDKKNNVINAFYILALVYAMALQYSASTERAKLILEINNANNKIEQDLKNKNDLDDYISQEIKSLKKSIAELKNQE